MAVKEKMVVDYISRGVAISNFMVLRLQDLPWRNKENYENPRL
jgi:hypothetical protein